MKRLVALLLLSAGCYRLDALIAPSAPLIELVGAPVTKHGTGNDPVVPLPQAVASGDLLLAAVLAVAPASPSAIWQVDGSLPSGCGPALVLLHRFATDSDVGGSLDLSPIIGHNTYDIVLAAFSHVGQLGSIFNQQYPPGTDTPYDVPVPPAQTGAHAWVPTYSYAFDVPLNAPIPTSLSVTGHAATCAFIAAQTLLPAR